MEIYTEKMELESIIRKNISDLGENNTKELMDRLNELGVTNIDDLQHVLLEDLCPLLKIVQARKLLRTSSGYAEVVSEHQKYQLRKQELEIQKLEIQKLEIQKKEQELRQRDQDQKQVDQELRKKDQELEKEKLEINKNLEKEKLELRKKDQELEKEKLEINKNLEKENLELRNKELDIKKELEKENQEIRNREIKLELVRLAVENRKNILDNIEKSEKSIQAILARCTEPVVTNNDTFGTSAGTVGGLAILGGFIGGFVGSIAGPAGTAIGAKTGAAWGTGAGLGAGIAANSLRPTHTTTTTRTRELSVTDKAEINRLQESIADFRKELNNKFLTFDPDTKKESSES